MVTIGAFVFSPFLRRLVEWKGNFDPLNMLAIFPLLMLLPIGVFAFRRRERVRNRTFLWLVGAWLVGFGYSAFIATAQGDLAPAVFVGGRFCFPLLVAMWLLTRQETMEEVHARLARVLLYFGAFAGVYGIFQYIIAPPWDTAWLQTIDVPGDFGRPERFGIRVFGVLNDPIVFALFLGVVILFNLPYLRVRSWFHMLALLAMTVSIMLSLYRTAWVTVFIGVVVYTLLFPNPMRNILRVSSVVAVCIVAAFAVLLAFPDAKVTQKVVDRFTTLSDVQGDDSFRERSSLSEATFRSALDQPQGVGLGLTGDAAKLGDQSKLTFSNGTGGSIDNGFLSRLVEMGFGGFFIFVAVCVASIGSLISAYRRLRAQNYRLGILVAASCLATQIVIFVSVISEDDLQGLLGMFFFMALVIPMLPSAAVQPLQPALLSRPRPLPRFARSPNA